MNRWEACIVSNPLSPDEGILCTHVRFASPKVLCARYLRNRVFKWVGCAKPSPCSQGNGKHFNSTTGFPVMGIVAVVLAVAVVVVVAFTLTHGDTLLRGHKAGSK